MTTRRVCPHLMPSFGSPPRPHRRFSPPPSSKRAHSPSPEVHHAFLDMTVLAMPPPVRGPPSTGAPLFYTVSDTPNAAPPPSEPPVDEADGPLPRLFFARYPPSVNPFHPYQAPETKPPQMFQCPTPVDGDADHPPNNLFLYVVPDPTFVAPPPLPLNCCTPPYLTDSSTVLILFEEALHAFFTFQPRVLIPLRLLSPRRL